MATKKEIWLKIISGLIASMFFYTVFVKFRNYEQANWDMRNQVFPNGIADILTWLVPSIEAVLVLLLVFKPTRLWGFKASLGLLTAFTLYISIALTNIFGRVPCNCGGIIGELSYGWHILFNLIFMLLAFLGICIENRWTEKDIWNKVKNTWYLIKKKGKLVRQKIWKRKKMQGKEPYPAVRVKKKSYAVTTRVPRIAR